MYAVAGLLDEICDLVESISAAVVEFEGAARHKTEVIHCKNNGLENRLIRRVERTVDENVFGANVMRPYAFSRRFLTSLETALEITMLPMRLFVGGFWTAGNPRTMTVCSFPPGS